jgi:branched-chain amino acid transport system substrate-binding protein
MVIARALTLTLVALLTAGPAFAQVSDGIVKIGVLNDQSSLYADLAGQGSVVAARMAVEDFGADKKGLKVEIIFADHQNKPDVGSQIARQWYDADKVDMIVDVPNSGVALAVNQITRDKGKAFVVSSAASSDLTGKACSPNTVHWTYDTWALANGTGNAVVKTGGDTWFFITADYVFGKSLEDDTTAVVKAAGGKVLGSVRFPSPGTTDFSSYVLQTQASGAKIVGLANAGADTVNCIKAANEYGVTKTQKLAGLLIFISDIHSLGLPTAKGLYATTAFYWNLNDETRKWSRRFQSHPDNKKKAMPTMVHAGVYSSVTHYLQAVQGLGTDDADAVMAKMREAPVNDFFAKNGRIGPDGLHRHDMYLVQVKSPEESKVPWDYYKVLKTIPAAQAFPSVVQQKCPLVR